MVNEAQSSEKYASNIAKYTFPLIVIGGVFIFYAQKVPFVHPHIRAPAYIPPIGCSAPIRQVKPEVPCSCADKKYLFQEAHKYGFHYFGRRNNEYYRVQNDAVEIANIGTGICSASEVVTDVFYQ